MHTQYAFLCDLILFLNITFLRCTQGWSTQGWGEAYLSTVHSPGIYPLCHKNKNKDVCILYVPVVCLFLFILAYNSYTQGNKEYSGTQPQPMSENNCWDHVPSSALLGNVFCSPEHCIMFMDAGTSTVCRGFHH